VNAQFELDLSLRQQGSTVRPVFLFGVLVSVFVVVTMPGTPEG
jgi:hypothetical protein